MTIGHDATEEDPGVEQGGGDTEPSADEEVEALGRVEEADQSMSSTSLILLSAVEL